MPERSFRTNLDRYLRKEDTFLARQLHRCVPLQGYAYRNSEAKRRTDRIIAFPMAACALPLIAILAIAKKLEDGGSCFYTQQRLDQHREPIDVIKIRCMRPDADQNMGANLHNAVRFGEDKDPRNTRLGSFMRKFELEELPQLLWVWKNLSLVEIRSAPQYVFDHLHRMCPDWADEWEEYYFSGIPGIDSLNSAVNRKRKDDTRRYHLDALYARKASLGLDLFVLYRTVVRMIDKLL